MINNGIYEPRSMLFLFKLPLLSIPIPTFDTDFFRIFSFLGNDLCGG